MTSACSPATTPPRLPCPVSLSACPDSSIVGNDYSFGCAGGTLASTGDNRVVNNPNPGCAPNAVVTVQ